MTVPIWLDSDNADCGISRMERMEPRPWRRRFISAMLRREGHPHAVLLRVVDRLEELDVENRVLKFRGGVLLAWGLLATAIAAWGWLR